MKLHSIILGALLVQCAVFAHFSGECPLFSDPNDYIDDPNTLDNGLFECGDPNLTIFDFIPPIYWERIPHPESYNQDDSYVSLHSSLEHENQRIKWEIENPFEGDTFVLLSTGGEDADDIIIKGSKMSQEVFLNAGDTILGAYFFGTTDYLYYNDYGQISLLFAGDPNDYPDPNDMPVNVIPIPGTRCDVQAVGNYKSTKTLMPETGGWISFTHTVEPNQIGPYLLTCEVVDEFDLRVNSYFAIDGLRICRGGKPISDLNDDCDVNLVDYSIFSEAWLSFCPDAYFYDPNFPDDPNDYPPPVTDPNILCQLADFDNSWFVDPNDLNIMSDQWLIGSSSDSE